MTNCPHCGGSLAPDKEFGRLVRETRLRKGLDHAGLAAKIGVNRETVRRLELGLACTNKTRYKAADLLKIDRPCPLPPKGSVEPRTEKGKELRALRLKLGVSLRWMDANSSFESTYLGRVELGKAKPSQEYVARLTEFYHSQMGEVIK